MIIPVGGPFQTQQLVLVTKDAKGKTTLEQLLPVRFVPLTGKH
jgi:protein-L-isoaspartate(D-aspartate) O-methyltransferase